MPKDYLQQPVHQVRRADRAIEDETWIKTFLHTAEFGVLATAVDEQPFVNTNLYLYDEADHAIYLHTARVGRTRALAEQNIPACFSISEMGRLLPAAEALEFSVEYKGVTVFGTLSVVPDEATATVKLQALLDKYFPHLTAGQDYRPPVPEELKRTSVYKLAIENWSAKQKQVADDFPGAFFYSDKL